MKKVVNIGGLISSQDKKCVPPSEPVVDRPEANLLRTARRSPDVAIFDEFVKEGDFAGRSRAEDEASGE